MPRRPSLAFPAFAPWFLLLACVAVVPLAASCGKSSSSVAPGPGGIPGPAPGSGGSPGDSARWAVAQAASDLYFSLKGDPDRDANTVAYLLSNPSVAFAGVSDSLGNVWACFDNGRLLLLIDNRRFVDPAPQDARRGAAEDAMRKALALMPPPFAGELPVSKKARLLNSLEARWRNSLPALSSILSTSGYQVSTPGSHLADLLSLSGDGVFYWATHAGIGGDLQQNAVFGVWTQTLCDTVADKLEPLKSYWRDGEICWASVEVQQPDGTIKPEFHYGITQKWIRNRWSFENHSIVFMDACTSDKQELRSAFFDKGADAYCGWNALTSSAAGVVNEIFFDLLCGTNAVNPATPNQRPFLFDWVRDWMVSNGKNVDPDPNPGQPAAVLNMSRSPADPTFGLLRPTIHRLFTHDAPSDPVDYIEIEGLFGSDPGAAEREVKIGGHPLANVLWSEYLIIADLPKSGAGSVGDVTVSVRGHLSNVAHLTRWLLPVKYIRYGQQSLQQQIEMTLILRGDAGTYRFAPYATPFATPTALYSSKVSTGSWLMSGIYRPDPDHYTKWTGFGTIKAATTIPQKTELGYLSAAGNINPSARTITSFLATTQVPYVIETESSQTPATAVLAPFGPINLSYNTDWVIKADSAGASLADGSAKLWWGPAAPDEPFNNGGR